jgi:hypothetical protein
MVDQFQVGITQFANIFGGIAGSKSIDRLLEPYIEGIDREKYPTKRDLIVYLLNTYVKNSKDLRNIVQTIIDVHNQSKWIGKIELINDSLNPMGLIILHVDPAVNHVEIISKINLDTYGHLATTASASSIKKVQSPQIFLSHSKEDEEIKTLFNKAFASTHVRAIYEEYEKLISGQVTVEKITKDIDSSVAVFVLLSMNVEKLQHTRDWVAFEAGYAYAKGIDVWVFEPLDEKNSITLVTPGLSYYVPLSTGDMEYVKIRKILDSYSKENAISSQQNMENYPVICPQCNSKYRVHIPDNTPFRCPVCNSKIFYLNSIKSNKALLFHVP